MCENFLNLISTCSSESKQRLGSFLLTLFTPDREQEERSAKLEAIFLKITQHLTLSKVREISKSERSRKDLTNYQFNYGEITFRTIHQILTKIQKYRPMGLEEVFYDLGSGSGKVLFAASLCHPFLKYTYFIIQARALNCWSRSTARRWSSRPRLKHRKRRSRSRSTRLGSRTTVFRACRSLTRTLRGWTGVTVRLFL